MHKEAVVFLTVGVLGQKQVKEGEMPRYLKEFLKQLRTNPDRIIMNAEQIKKYEELKRWPGWWGKEDGSETIENINEADMETKKEYIWNYLVNEFGLSEMHAAAIMGNIQQESNFSATNAQNSYGYPGDDDVEYIDKYAIKDNIGWGLIQWTYYTRKQGLLDYAVSKGASVGDITIQLEYLFYEVYDGPYKSKFQTFLQITDIDELRCTSVKK